MSSHRPETNGAPSPPARTLHIVKDVAAAAEAAAEIVARIAKESVTARGRFLLVLSGGRTALPLFDTLAHDYALRIDWPAAHVFWADERCVPPDDEASNYGAAKRHLLSHVPVAPTGVHRIRGELAPPVAAGAYQTELAQFFGMRSPREGTAFDLVLLGMGGDGHTASIFEGSPALESPEWAVGVEAPPGTAERGRVTLTAAAISASRHALMLVTGEAKADAVRRALEPGTRLPAGLVAAQSGMTWILDERAASALDRP